MNEERCACGRPLHYSDPEIQRLTESVIAQAGSPTIDIVTHFLGEPTGRRFRVQRHYIALHGIKAADLPKLARQGIVEELPA